MRYFSRLLLVVFLSALPVPLTAAPDLSGRWKLNPAESDFGPTPAPNAASYVISQDGSSLVIDWSWSGPSGDMTGRATYTTNGEETTNTFGDLELTSVAHWEGEILHINSKGSLMGTDMEFVDTWTLETPNQLTVRRHMNSSMGEMEQVLVFERVE